MYNNDQNGGYPQQDSQRMGDPSVTPISSSTQQTAAGGYSGFSFQVQPADNSSDAYRPAASPVTPPPTPPVQEQPSKRQSTPTWGRIIAFCLVCTILGGALGAGIFSAVTQNSTPVSTSPVTTSQPQSVVSTSDGSSSNDAIDYEAVYAACNPACVAITVSGTDTNFFGQVSQYASSGSGFVISSDGYIVTNHHVIEGASDIEILFSDGTTYSAELIASDKSADVALLKVDAANLPYLSFGDSDALVVGQNVVAIGNPLGELANTMTTGIISALDREINIDGTVMNVLQTNAAVSPGNSGCPLLDKNGSVIGVINSKSDGTSVEGIGFAIPSNDVQKVIDDLMEYGYVRDRAALGVTINVAYNSMYAQYYNMPAGAYVQEVSSGSAAEKAGIQANDIITAIDGKTITSYDDMSSALLNYNAGDTATITVSRAGESIDLTITFDEKASSSSTEETPSETETPDDNGFSSGLPGVGN